jgi:hypothetical protein
VRGFPIQVTCECGNERSLAYGERWRCERCEREYDTARIPEAEYRGLMRDLRRYRLEMVGAALAIAAVFLPLAFFVNMGLLFVLPFLLAFGAIFYGPVWKKRVRRRIAERPRWELEPE